MTDEELDELTEFVYRNVTGLRVTEADRALDEARLILWGAAFSGKSIPGEWEGPSPTIARRLAHLPLDRVSQILEETRLSIWMEVFPKASPNLFGGLLDSAQELQ